jgi:hypothetical protein
MPFAALALGLAGLIPFVAGAALPVFAPNQFGLDVEGILAIYAAVILSFMGGVHWGLALKDGITSGYVASVLPALAAWGAVAFLARDAAFVVLIAAFLGLLAYDIAVISSGRAPPWYRPLRIGLTTVVAACLAVPVLT